MWTVGVAKADQAFGERPARLVGIRDGVRTGIEAFFGLLSQEVDGSDTHCADQGDHHSVFNGRCSVFFRKKVKDWAGEFMQHVSGF